MVCARYEWSKLMGKVFRKPRVNGFTLVELMVIIAILVVVAGMILPANRPRTPAIRIKCVNSLRSIGLVFRVFATDHEERFPMQVWPNEGGSLEVVAEGVAFRHFVVMSNQLGTPVSLVCPSDTKRKAATNFPSVTVANLSYFVGLNATNGQPQSLLAGDRNLSINGSPIRPGLVELTTNLVVGWTAEMHNLQGNIAMGDGSVQQFSGTRLRGALRDTGQVTNMLAVP